MCFENFYVIIYKDTKNKNQKIYFKLFYWTSSRNEALDFKIIMLKPKERRTIEMQKRDINLFEHIFIEILAFYKRDFEEAVNFLVEQQDKLEDGHFRRRRTIRQSRQLFGHTVRHIGQDLHNSEQVDESSALEDLILCPYVHNKII